MISRCFLKFPLKELKKRERLKKLFEDIWEFCSHDSNNNFSNTVAPSHIITSEYPRSNFSQIAKRFCRSNVITYCLGDYRLWPIFKELRISSRDWMRFNYTCC